MPGGIVAVALLLCAVAHASEVTAKLTFANSGKVRNMPHPTPAVIWLNPISSAIPPATPGRFTLLQKDKMFSPHLLVIPVGSSVSFPNADPFFHNVFSLFDGKRFDLGLYEAGSTRSVLFSHEGVSYIFCNIHPEMSAVVLSLSSPFFSVSDGNGSFRIHDVPEGDYDLHVWVEGRRDDALRHLTRRVHIAAGVADLGEIPTGAAEKEEPHLNKYGQPYMPETRQPY